MPCGRPCLTSQTASSNPRADAGAATKYKEHAKASSPDDRARHLNAEGFRPPKRSPVFTPNAVRDLLQALGIHRSRNPAPHIRPVLTPHEWWLRDPAAARG